MQFVNTAFIVSVFCTNRRSDFLTFYEIYEWLCKKRGISPTRAAQDNGIKQQSVSAWKTRGSIPKAETVQRLADYFGVSVDYLLDSKPLPQKEITLSSGKKYFVNSRYQELTAIENFLREMGYAITFDDPDAGGGASLCDARAGKRYAVSIGRLRDLSNSIDAFTKYQVAEMIAGLEEMPYNRATDAPQSPPAPTEGQRPPRPQTRQKRP